MKSAGCASVIDLATKREERAKAEADKRAHVLVLIDAGNAKTDDRIQWLCERRLRELYELGETGPYHRYVGRKVLEDGSLQVEFEPCNPDGEPLE